MCVCCMCPCVCFCVLCTPLLVAFVVFRVSLSFVFADCSYCGLFVVIGCCICSGCLCVAVLCVF